MPAEAGGDNEAAEPTPDNEMAELEAAQGKRGSLAEYSPEASSTGPTPGESFSTYVARNTSKKPVEKAVEAQATEGPEAAASDEAKATVAQTPHPWKIVDKATGRVLGVIDPQKVDALNQERASERAAAYVSGTPDNRKGIIEGMTSAARTPEEVETGMKHGEFTFGQLEKTDRTVKNHKGGGGAGGDQFSSKLASTANDDMLQYVSKAVTNSGAPKLNQAANDGAKVADLAGSPIALEQKVAAGQMLKSLFGAAASEGERAYVFGSEGEFTRLQQLANNWLNGGQMPEGFQEALRHAASRMQELAAKKAAAISDKAAEDALNSPLLGGRLGKLTPEQRAAVKAPLVNVGRVETDEGKAGSANEEASKLGF